MAVRVGSARIDERGRASGGKAGDQTGREVAIENWYVHPQGWYIIRAKDPETREKIAKGMERACANNNIGYDQGQNQTLWKEASKVGWDPGKVSKPVETDCARLVREVLKYAGIDAPDFFTGNELASLQKTGKFEIIKDKRCNSSAELMRGDILVTRTKGHTVVVLDDGANTKKAKEAAKKPAPAKKKTVAQIAQEVIDGKWGSGDTRKKKLKAAGYDYATVQAKVNALLAKKKTTKKAAKKSNKQIAKEVIAGKWGNGVSRVLRLKAAGYNYKEIQKEVNKLI